MQSSGSRRNLYQKTIEVRVLIVGSALIAACSSPSLPAVNPVQTNFPSDRITCPKTTLSPHSCPEPICPVCPKLAQPATKDWYCIDYRKPDGRSASSCWVELYVCNHTSERIRKKGARRISECRAQEVAHCFQLLDPLLQLRQFMCTRTESDCRRLQLAVATNRPSSTDIVTICTRALNSDSFTEPRIHQPD